MTLSFLASPLFIEYAVTFWITHSWAAVVGVLVFFVLAFVGLERWIYERWFRPTWFWHIGQGFRRRRQILIALTLAMVLLCLIGIPPLVHLYFAGWVQVSMAILPILLIVNEYWILFRSELREVRVIPAINRDRVGKKSWNVASIGVQCLQAAHDAEHHKDLVDKYGPMGEETLKFILEGADFTWWAGNDALIRRLAEIMGTEPGRVELFDRTTEALRAAVVEAIGNARSIDATRRPTIVTTDAEYDEVTRVLRHLTAEKDVELTAVPVKELMWQGLSESHIRAELSGAISATVDMVCISHVFFETGLMLDVEALVRDLAVRRREKPLYWIIDGAQALGNADVSKSLIDAVDYYATSGHKWLGGLPTLGVLCRRETAKGKWRVNSTRSFSTFGDRGRRGGTVNLAAQISLSGMLTEYHRIGGLSRVANHNRELAQVMVNMMQDRVGFKALMTTPSNGIVTLHGDRGRIGAVVQLFKKRGIEHTYIQERDAIRLCCHYYHSETDVYELVETALEAVSL